MARRPQLGFLKTHAGAAVVLGVAALAALVFANSPVSDEYFGFVGQWIPVRLGDFAETRTLGQWVKDGLMTVFVLMVGMEIKFEVVRGDLSSPRRLALPILAALGGLVGPALIYWLVERGAGLASVVWPAGAATDIAFALAALAIAAPRLPPAARVFLLGVAIADDLAAIALVAVKAVSRLDNAALAGAALGLLSLLAISRWRRAPYLLYAAGFAIVWACVLRSGLSSSLAGIACAACVPAGARRPGQDSVLTYFIDSLHPYVAYAILPLYAFTAAGVSLAALHAGDWTAPLTVGLVLALAVGKPLGVFGFAALAAALRLARRPAGVGWGELAGAALLCGVGFTVSLYVAALALPGGDAAMLARARLGVIGGSLISLVFGAALVSVVQRRRARRGAATWD